MWQAALSFLAECSISERAPHINKITARLHDSTTAFTSADIGKDLTIEGDIVSVGAVRRTVHWRGAVHIDLNQVKITNVTRFKVQLEGGQEISNPQAVGSMLQDRHHRLSDLVREAAVLFFTKCNEDER